MTFIVKEFGWTNSARSPFTTSAVFRTPQSKDKVYFLFFEWISPTIDHTDFKQIIGLSFKKFYAPKKFTHGLKNFASYLLALFREYDLSEVDINFVIGRLTPKSLRIAKFGQADVYIFKNNKIADLTTVIPMNLNLNNLNYVKLPYEPRSLLFITNFGLFSSLIENDILPVSDEVSLLSGLDALSGEVLDSKSILMIADLDPNAKSQLYLGKGSTEGTANVKAQITSDSLQHSYISGNLDNVLSSTDNKKDDNVSISPIVTSKTEVGLQEMKKDYQNFKQEVKEMVDWFSTYTKLTINYLSTYFYKAYSIFNKHVANPLFRLIKVGYRAILGLIIHKNFKQGKNLTALKERSGMVQSQSLLSGMHGKHKLSSGLSNSESGRDYDEHKQVLSSDYFDKPVDTALKSSNNVDNPKNSTPEVEAPSASDSLNKITALNINDPVKYFKMRKSFTGKLYITGMSVFDRLIKFFVKLGAKHSVNRGEIVGKTLGTSAEIGSHLSNRLRKNRFKKFLLVLGGMVIGLIIIGQVRKIYKIKKQDVNYIQEARSQLNNLNNIFEQLSSSSSLGISDFNKCFDSVTHTRSLLESLKAKVHFADNQAVINSLQNKVDNTEQQCKKLYNETFNVKSIQTRKILKDFKATFGEKSQVSSVSVYKGVLIVTDLGRGIVYQVNPENGKAVRLKDPKELVKQPFFVGFGENKDGTPLIFVCDQQSGILYYVSGFGFKQIPGTDAVALGSKCMQVAGFGTNAYFTTEDGTYLYKAISLGGGYAFPKAYITIKNSGKILDFTIDGSIYTLMQYPNKIVQENGSSAQNSYSYIYTIEKYFGGQKDRFSLATEDKKRMKQPSLIYTNPSGYKPLYVYDKQNKYIFEMEKPLAKKHPGIGTFVKTIDISNINNGNIEDFAVDLSVSNNQEQIIYVLADNKLYKLKNP